MKHHAFLACHPAVNLLYFVLVLTFSMFFLHPLCIACFCIPFTKRIVFPTGPSRRISVLPA